MIRLVAFLGNYGSQYKNNRHNVAWQFCQALSCMNGCTWQKKFKGQYASLERKDFAGQDDEGAGGAENKLFFLLPETYMNLSGTSIGELASFFKIKAEEILVVHDELELAPGYVSFKWSGGLGGHNGLRSTKEVLGTADFWRLRFGIGRPSHPDVAGYVLSDFTADEKIQLAQVFMRTEPLFRAALSQKPETLIKEWGKKKLLD